MDKRNKVLGELYSTARSRLIKMVLFKLLIEYKLNICFRCNKLIEKIEDLSIEHKIGWVNSIDPKKYFYDLENIAFSHIRCNCGARVWTEDSKKSFTKLMSGENNHKSKLTNEQVILIRENKNSTTRQLAKEFNVDHSRIVRIKNNESYINPAVIS